MRIGITRFPGTNCDYDIWKMVEDLGHDPIWLWHSDHYDIRSIDLVVIPGGFSYGDYLRCGALAAKSPVMNTTRDFAAQGRPVLGICNGFQILCESGLLPGVLTRNIGQRFIDKWIDLKIENTNPFFAKNKISGTVFRLPIAHGEGRYYASSEVIKQLQDNEQIWISYQLGSPNGSLLEIAGIMNENKNVAGLMPHPERALHDWMGGVDGADFL